jgi:transcription initiation factor TFIIIB Brf1 subunit/transcription initiation factor TFIIB
MNISGSGNSELGDNLARLTKESQMQVFTECEDCLTISGQNTEGAIAEASGHKLRPQTTPSMLQYIAWLPQARRLKILEIRRQLARGTYDLNERLDAVLEHLLKAITTLDNTDDRSC